MIFSHAFAGAALTALTIKSSKIKLTQKQKDLLYTTGAFFSVFPDFDVIVVILNKFVEHRAFLTHSVIPYLLAFWLGILFLKSKKNVFGTLLLRVFFLGVLSHLVLDFLSGGIAMFAPFNYQIYGLELKIDALTRKEWYGSYLMSSYMNIEVSILVLYIMVSRIARNRVYKVLPMFFLLVAVLSTVVLNLL